MKVGHALACPLLLLLAGCSQAPQPAKVAEKKEATPVYFHVDAATAGVVKGAIHYSGKKPARQAIDMSNEPACLEAHKGKAYDESLVIGANGALVNAFVYVKSGLEGKTFEPPTRPVVIDQRGCAFGPRVMGIQTGQPLEVTNSDPVTHNIHPLAKVNREWNHSQGAGDPPITRRFAQPEILIPVKCNIHRWMHAYIAAVPHPYYAVTGGDGSFEIKNLPPGDYVIEAWQENLGTQEQKVTVTSSGNVEVRFEFKGE